MKKCKLVDFSTIKGDVSMMVLANQGTSLVVNDAAFIVAASRLKDTLNLLRRFLPLLAAALAVIGYFIAYLMVHNRSEEYAVFRLLGVSKLGNMGMYLVEIATLTLGGCIIGVLISTAVGIGDVNTSIRVFALLSICFLLGSIAALLRLGRAYVMLALSQAE